MVEMLITIVILILLTNITLRFHTINDSSYYTFPNEYARIQSECMLSTVPAEYESSLENNPLIRFNENGNVNQARTLSFYVGNRIRQIVIELGTGRLVIRE